MNTALEMAVGNVAVAADTVELEYGVVAFRKDCDVEEVLLLHQTHRAQQMSRELSDDLGLAEEKQMVGEHLGVSDDSGFGTKKAV